MKKILFFTLFVLFSFECIAANYDPTAIHDRGKQTLIGDLTIKAPHQVSGLGNGKLTAAQISSSGDLEASRIATTAISDRADCPAGKICVFGNDELEDVGEITDRIADMTGISVDSASAIANEISNANGNTIPRDFNFDIPSGINCNTVNVYMNENPQEWGFDAFVLCGFHNATPAITGHSIKTSGLIEPGILKVPTGRERLKLTVRDNVILGMDLRIALEAWLGADVFNQISSQLNNNGNTDNNFIVYFASNYVCSSVQIMNSPSFPWKADAGNNGTAQCNTSILSMDLTYPLCDSDKDIGNIFVLQWEDSEIPSSFSICLGEGSAGTYKVNTIVEN